MPPSSSCRRGQEAEPPAVAAPERDERVPPPQRRGPEQAPWALSL